MYTIKPLEWEKRTDFYVAYSVFGLLVVFPTYWHSQKFSKSETCESIDHGKQLAEAWYVAKLGEALEPVEERGAK